MPSPIRFLSASVTQGSADAFAVTSVATGLANLNSGLLIRGITYETPLPVEVDSDLTIQLIRRTPTALLSIGNRQLIHQWNRTIRITTSGMAIVNTYPEYSYPKDFNLIVVEDPIYLAVDSSSTSATNGVGVRIYYDLIRLTENEKLSALSESLNP